MKKPDNKKERNLLKGAMRRVFSRSQLRRQALIANFIEHADPERPRVTNWAWCSLCGVIEPAYKMQVDHRIPLVPIDKTLDDMEWDDVIERLWCDLDNLQAVCESCHHDKSKAEAKERKARKKGNK